MRRFMLWLASMSLGLVTVGGVLALFGPDAGSGVVTAVVTWVPTFLVAMFLSAPFFLAPPNTIREWSFRVPMVVWLVLIAFRIISWVGLMILRGAWTLVFLVVGHANGPRGEVAPPGMAPSPVVPSPVVPSPVVPSPVMPSQPAGPAGGPHAAPPPSWQRDPTGRFPQRYWDGHAWTAHVTNGATTAIDPI